MKLAKIYSTALMLSLLLQSASAFGQEAIPPAGYEEEVRVQEVNWFSDLNPDSRIGTAANFLADAGIVGGFPDGTFRENQLVNRAEIAKFITNADTNCYVGDQKNNGKFSDVKEGEWYVRYVIAAAVCGIIQGNPNGTYAPQRSVNTAELLAMLSRADLSLPIGLSHSYSDVPADAWFAQYAGIAKQYELFPDRGNQLRPGQSLTRGEVAYALYRILQSTEGPTYPRLTSDLSIVVSGTPRITSQSTLRLKARVANQGPHDTSVRIKANGQGVISPVDTQGQYCDGVACSTIPAGEFKIFPINIDLSDCTESGDITHSVTVEGANFDPNLSGNTFHKKTYLRCMNETIEPVEKGADLSVSLGHVSTVGPQDEVLYSVKIFNNGPEDATGVQFNHSGLSDTLFIQKADGSQCTGNNCSQIIIPAGDAYTFTIGFPASAQIPCDGSYHHTVKVSSKTYDPITWNNTVTSDGPRKECTVNSGDVDLYLQDLQAFPNVAELGGTVTFTKTIENKTSTEPNILVLKASIPQGTYFNHNGSHPNCSMKERDIVCTQLKLQEPIAVSFTIPKFRTCANNLTYSVEVSAAQKEKKPQDNREEVRIPVSCNPSNSSFDLSLKDTRHAVDSSSITFYQTVHKEGNGTPDQPKIMGRIPNGLTLNTTNSHFSCTASSQFFTCNKVPLDTKIPVSFRLPTDNVCITGQYTVNVSSQNSETNVGNNSASIQYKTCNEPPPSNNNRLDIWIDGPTSQSYAPNEKDAVLANVQLNPNDSVLDVKHMYMLLEGRDSTGRMPDAKRLSDVVEDIEIRNKVSGQTIDGVRMTNFGSFGSTSEYTWQVYRFDDFVIRGKEAWDIRTDFTDTEKLNTGDTFRARICSEPDKLPNGEENPQGCTFNLLSFSNTSYQLRAENLQNRAVADVQPRGTILGNQHSITTSTPDIEVSGAWINRTPTHIQMRVTIKNIGTEPINTQGSVTLESTSPTLEYPNRYYSVNSLPINLAPGVGMDVALSNYTIDASKELSTAFKAVVHTIPGEINLSNNTKIQTITSPATTAKVDTSNLFITMDSIPVPNRQLLGGELSDSVLQLEMRVDTEPVDVTAVGILAHGNIDAVDRLELFLPGSSTPFAHATKGACSANTNISGDFCAIMNNRQLLIAQGGGTSILVRSLIKSDNESISSSSVTFELSSSRSIRARGDQSSNVLQENNDNSKKEGEVFIGTSTAGSNRAIVGPEHIVVFAKVASITNANPDANGTSVPIGTSAIGQFKFTAASHRNTKNGLNKIYIDDILFTVNAQNVDMEGSEFYIYNKADSTKKFSCNTHTTVGPLSGPISGKFYVNCQNIDIQGMNADIGEGSSTTFVVEGNVLNPKTGNETSSLQVSLTNVNNPTYSSFGYPQSHLRWQDRESGSVHEYNWIEYPETTINSTLYRS